MAMGMPISSGDAVITSAVLDRAAPRALSIRWRQENELLAQAGQHVETLEHLLQKTAWTTHAIDTSWSMLHAPLLGNLDGDGQLEVIAGKRFQGHEGKDPARTNPYA